ncbi:MAG: hypothetical protein AAFP15_16595 [Bacteroidota bacterium]
MRRRRPALGRIVATLLVVNMVAFTYVMVAFTYVVATDGNTPDPYYPFVYGIVLLGYGAVHSGLLLIGGVALLFTERKQLAGGLLLSALAIVLVGASFCFGGLAAFDYVL